MRLAIEHSYPAWVHRLLDADERLATTKYNVGQTPLHLAAIKGHPEVLEVILGAGAEVDILDKYGHTALHLAAGAGRVEAIKLLIDQGAKVDARNSTP